MTPPVNDFETPSIANLVLRDGNYGKDNTFQVRVDPAKLERVTAYLGDVGESPTGDKKAERFEDAYLDELMPALREMGSATQRSARGMLPSTTTRLTMTQLTSRSDPGFGC